GLNLHSEDPHRRSPKPSPKVASGFVPETWLTGSDFYLSDSSTVKTGAFDERIEHVITSSQPFGTGRAALLQCTMVAVHMSKMLEETRQQPDVLERTLAEA